MAKLFDAKPDAGLEWRETGWIGDRVPVVVRDADGRRLATQVWGLPADCFSKPVAAKQSGTLYPRDLSPSASRLHEPTGFRPCLILIESFAYPGGFKGQCTRNWFGLWDETLTAWAGLCTPGGHCAGILGRANEQVEPYSDAMPLLLASADRESWLAGAGFLALRADYVASDFYRENLGERWSTGRLCEEAPPRLAA